jgi:hypothetical protein
MNSFTYTQLSVPDTLLVTSNNNREVIKITPSGEIYWNGRLVETDQDFKASMLELAEYLKGNRR